MLRASASLCQRAVHGIEESGARYSVYARQRAAVESDMLAPRARKIMRYECQRC